MKRSIIIACLLFAIQPLSAQQQPGFVLAVDAASFRYDANQSYVELYYSFSRRAVLLQQNDNGFTGLVNMRAVLTRQDKPDAVPELKVWNIPVMVTDTAGLPDLRMVGRINYALDPGSYLVSVTVRDQNNAARVDTLSFVYQVPKYPSTQPAFSEVQFASSIKPIEPDSTNIFYKNTLEVVPNPAGLFGEGMPVLYYYVELYNVSNEKYSFNYEVISSYGKTVLSKRFEKSGATNAKVEVGAVNVVKLPTGKYLFSIACSDPSGKVKATQSKPFYVYNPSVAFDTASARSTASIIANEFVNLTEDELDTRFDQARYIVEKDEKILWSSLKGSEAKKKYLTQFWEKRDPNTATPANENYIEYQARIEYVNQAFRSAYMPGWKSDRGRVYIMYGAPDDIERNVNAMDTYPYEIWRYNQYEGGVLFVFLDKNNSGMYQLVHSTKEGELSDPNWEDFIK